MEWKCNLSWNFARPTNQPTDRRALRKVTLPTRSNRSKRPITYYNTSLTPTLQTLCSGLSQLSFYRDLALKRILVKQVFKRKKHCQCNGFISTGKREIRVEERPFSMLNNWALNKWDAGIRSFKSYMFFEVKNLETLFSTIASFHLGRLSKFEIESWFRNRLKSKTAPAQEI